MLHIGASAHRSHAYRATYLAGAAKYDDGLNQLMSISAKLDLLPSYFAITSLLNHSVSRMFFARNLAPFSLKWVSSKTIA